MSRREPRDEGAAPRRLRVAALAPAATHSGAEQWLLLMVEASRRSDVEAVVLQDGPLVPMLRERGVRTEVRRTGARLDMVAAVWWFARWLRRHRPDVVCASGLKAAVIAIPAALLTSTRVVWVRHDFSYSDSLARLTDATADGVAAATEALAEGLRNRNRTVVGVPLPDEEPATREEAREFWKLQGLPCSDRPVAAVVGRLVDYKGVDDAVAALAEPGAEAWALAVVGGDDPAAPGTEARLRLLASELDVAHRVHFLGTVPNAQHWMAGFDAVVQLTKQVGPFGREGIGTAVAEALRAGVPVVTTRGVPAGAHAHGGAVVVDDSAPAQVAAALADVSAGRVPVPPDAYPTPTPEVAAARLEQFLADTAGRAGAGAGPGDGPPVSLVLALLDEEAVLASLLEELRAQMRADDELVCVDAGSRDATAAIVEAAAASDPRVRLVRPPGTGPHETANPARARNAGVAAARHDVIAYTDAGCEPDARWLQAIRAPFADPDPPDVVCGTYRVAARDTWQRAMVLACYPDVDEVVHPSLLARAYGALLGLAFDAAMPTRSVAVARDAWLAAGGQPEHLATAEDVTFTRAIADAGGRCVIASDATVTWEQRPTVAATARMYYRYGLGGGRSGDRLVLARDLARALAYAAGPVAWLAGGRRVRALVALGAAAYLSLPLARAARLRPARRAVATAALVPAAMATKDVSKAAGCVAALTTGAAPS